MHALTTSAVQAAALLNCFALLAAFPTFKTAATYMSCHGGTPDVQARGGVSLLMDNYEEENGSGGGMGRTVER